MWRTHAVQGPQTTSPSENWLVRGLVKATKRTDVGWIDDSENKYIILVTECPRCTRKDRALLQQNNNQHVCDCLYPKQGVMWRQQILLHARHEAQLRLQRRSCLKRLPICRPSVGWKWFLCVRWTLNSVAEMQSTPLWSQGITWYYGVFLQVALTKRGALWSGKQLHTDTNFTWRGSTVSKMLFSLLL